MKYSTIVADPPWKVMAGPLCGREGFGDATGRSRPLAYPSMSVAQIAELPVGRIADANAHLYLWTINRYVDEAFDVARDWGFQYSTLLTWAKNPMGKGLGGAYGISTEFVLFCRRGKLRTKQDIGTTWFNWKRPYDSRGKPKHSAKPPEFQSMVETVSPGPYLELFARNGRPGWDSWGDEFCTADVFS